MTIAFWSQISLLKYNCYKIVCVRQYLTLIWNDCIVAISFFRFRVKDKADRATMEQVMDPRTRMILFKLLNRGFISEINGCISTGKEANVYHCNAKEGPDQAIKIYKTSILVFKDRDKYVTGEFRFRSGYGKKNPRKMVRTWAEKEMRNLTRLYNEGIPCPKPTLLRYAFTRNFCCSDFTWNQFWR